MDALATIRRTHSITSRTIISTAIFMTQTTGLTNGLSKITYIRFRRLLHETSICSAMRIVSLLMRFNEDGRTRERIILSTRVQVLGAVQDLTTTVIRDGSCTVVVGITVIDFASVSLDR